MTARRLLQQLVLLVRTGFLLGVPIGIFFGVLYGVTRLNGIPFSSLTRDPSATFSYPWYGGAVSHLGVIIAISSSAVLLLSARLGRHLGQHRLASFANFLGIGLIMFGFDDLLMLHENSFSIGIPELAILAIYPVGFAALIFRYWSVILEQTDFGILAAAAALMAIQGGADTHLMPISVSSSLVEDPLKISALILLFAYGFRIFSDLVASMELTNDQKKATSH